MAAKQRSFRVGRVQAYLRGKVWYFCYHEHGRRKRPRVGTDRASAKLLAAQTNAQLESGAPAMLSFEPVPVPVLRERWLDHHEHVLRSSVHSIRRYRAATQHLVTFVEQVQSVREASRFRVQEAEAFARYLRTLKVASNGHAHTVKRNLYDKGVRFILESCRALFNFAARHRHLSPYAPNPFAELQLERIPVETRRPVTLFSDEQERSFLERCDDWQFPLFLTLMLTGLRVGEATHLYLPEDLDLQERILTVRNRPMLGWRVKTRRERVIPLVSGLVAVLERSLSGRKVGPLFRRRTIEALSACKRPSGDLSEMELEHAKRVRDLEGEEKSPSRDAVLRVGIQLWREVGALKNEQVRREYLQVCKKARITEYTCPKALRHLFATRLQSANVDPLIRMELMGHAFRGDGSIPGLGMTAVYTHTQPETRRKQLEQAFEGAPALEVARKWLNRQRSGHPETTP